MQSIKFESLIAGQEQQGFRLDVFLAKERPGESRSHWKVLIMQQAVRVNELPVKPNYKLQKGDIITCDFPENNSGEPLAEEIMLKILYEDEAVLVLNKPAGLVVHPAPGNETGTLVNALLFHDPLFKNVERAGIVHRLDKDTSGVMVVAKSMAAMEELQRQFKARETQKEYLALVVGAPKPSARIETQISRHPVHRKKMAVVNEGGRSAISSYEVIEQFDGIAYVRVKIETGRTHQIRVHMTHVGHPVLGDSVYGRSRKGRIKAARQMLHAARLEFTHPESAKRLSFEAPLFEDMHQLLDQLRG